VGAACTQCDSSVLVTTTFWKPIRHIPSANCDIDIDNFELGGDFFIQTAQLEAEPAGNLDFG